MATGGSSFCSYLAFSSTVFWLDSACLIDVGDGASKIYCGDALISAAFLSSSCGLTV